MAAANAPLSGSAPTDSDAHNASELLPPPVPLPKMLLLVNNFIITTTRFLNRFSDDCGFKLAEIGHRITVTETTLCLLEGKLRSVPAAFPAAFPAAAAAAGGGGSGGGAVAGDRDGDEEEDGPPPPPPPPPPPSYPSAPSGNNEPAPAEAAGEEAATANLSNTTRAAEHPRYRTYFRMLQMHIPLQAVAQKLSLELPGEDVSLLERPDEPIKRPPDG